MEKDVARGGNSPSEHNRETAASDLQVLFSEAFASHQAGNYAEAERRYQHGLDLGCGTGLSGLAFRALAARLTGVDLSAKMLEKARSKNVYDTLRQDDIVAFLKGTEDTFDLFIATDVFIYLGDLVPVFTGVRERAAKPAYLAFSIERADEGRDYELRTTGRYAQSVGYIRRLAAELGFMVVTNEERNIRREQGQWIEGNIFILKLLQG
jgi:predicted TPR repeat methyltransferase